MQINDKKLREVRDVVAQFPEGFSVKQLLETIDWTLSLTRESKEEIEKLERELNMLKDKENN